MIVAVVALALLSLIIVAVAAFASYYTKTPIRLYGLAVPVVAFWIFLPVTVLALAVAAVEYSLRRPSSIGMQVAVAAVVAFLGSWLGSAAARGVAKMLKLA